MRMVPLTRPVLIHMVLRTFIFVFYFFLLPPNAPEAQAPSAGAVSFSRSILGGFPGL